MVTAAASAVDFTAVAAFMAAASPAVAFTAAASQAVDFAAVGVSRRVDFTEIGFTIATSTTGSSSLAALETRSFTIPIHTTDIIPTAIILMAMDMVAFVEWFGFRGMAL